MTEILDLLKVIHKSEQLSETYLYGKIVHSKYGDILFFY